MSAPLVVNTKDGTVWTRREGMRGGEALYAPEKCGTCPQFVMATLTELAEQGIAGSTDALPMPTGPAPRMLPEDVAAIAELIGDAKPATPALLVSFGESVRDRREHDHSTQFEDWYCLNLSAYMGERMGPVLRRLLDAEAEADRLRAQLAASEQRSERRRIAWRMARTRALSTGGAADRYAAHARDAQEALQHMLFTVIGGQLALHAANEERQALRARVAELETERATTNRALVDTTLAQRAAEGRPADEDPIAFALTPAADDVAPLQVTRSVEKLRTLLAGQREQAGGAS